MTISAQRCDQRKATLALLHSPGTRAYRYPSRTKPFIEDAAIQQRKERIGSSGTIALANSMELRVGAKEGLGGRGVVKADVRSVIDQSGLAGWWFRGGMLGMAL